MIAAIERLERDGHLRAASGDALVDGLSERRRWCRHQSGDRDQNHSARDHSIRSVHVQDLRAFTTKSTKGHEGWGFHPVSEELESIEARTKRSPTDPSWPS